jgi:catechol 2,3-dioxygenase-like lactoylglutathione lyase family enzyme
MKPTFEPGRNIAMKVPVHEYDATVAFYRDVLGLRPIPGPATSSTESVRFDFGGAVLWIDRAPALSQAELWLEVVTRDLTEAARHFEEHGCVRRDEIEALPDGFQGFWVSSPSNIIHLVTVADDGG